MRLGLAAGPWQGHVVRSNTAWPCDRPKRRTVQFKAVTARILFPVAADLQMHSTRRWRSTWALREPAWVPVLPGYSLAISSREFESWRCAGPAPPSAGIGRASAPAAGASSGGLRRTFEPRARSRPSSRDSLDTLREHPQGCLRDRLHGGAGDCETYRAAADDQPGLPKGWIAVDTSSLVAARPSEI